MAILVFSLLLSFSFQFSANAQPVRRHQVKAYLNRTVLILHEAKDQLNIGKNYTGEYAKAIAHQKMARNLFQSGEFQKAVFHSHRARQLAFNVIRNNKGQVKKEFDPTKEEEGLQSNPPKEDELDRSLIKTEPGMAFDDKAAVQVQVKQIDDK